MSNPTLSLLLALFLFLLPACSPAEKYSSMPSFSTGEVQMATGDWDDVEAAVRVAAEKCQVAVVSVDRPNDRTIAFGFTTPTDERGTLTATRRLDAGVAPKPSDGPAAIELEARIGLFGDRHAERQFLRAIQDRLSGLTGVDWAPVRGR